MIIYYFRNYFLVLNILFTFNWINISIYSSIHSIKFTTRGFTNLSHSHVMLETDRLVIGSSNG